MRILQVCIGNPFTPTMYYKENYLLDAFLEAGHTPLILADTTTWQDGKIVMVPAGDTTLENGVRVVRVDLGHGFLRQKLRWVHGFSDLVVSLQPDVMLVHTIQQHGICDLRELRQRLPQCRFYADVSTAYQNSAKNWLSRSLLHRSIYRAWIQKSLPYWDKIFYVNEESKQFLQEMYGVPNELMELNALPGVIMPPEEKASRKAEFRSAHGLADDQLVLFHSGKMDAMKRTGDLLDAMARLPEGRARLFIAGSFYDDVREVLTDRIARMPNVTYLGFLNQDEMQTALAAADLYCQPGSASQTAQAAIACGTPVIVYGEAAYGEFIHGNGVLLSKPEDIQTILPELVSRPDELARMSDAAYKLAGELLDYRALAARLYR